MNEEYMFVPDKCKECMNWNGEECLLLPVEEEICLENGGELFVEKEKGE